MEEQGGYGCYAESCKVIIIHFDLIWIRRLRERGRKRKKDVVMGVVLVVVVVVVMLMIIITILPL